MDDLTELGAGDPQDFLGKFALERVAAWVKWALAQPAGRLRNPAGYIFRKLEEGKDPPTEPNPWRRIARGKYGHLVKH